MAAHPQFADRRLSSLGDFSDYGGESCDEVMARVHRTHRDARGPPPRRRPPAGWVMLIMVDLLIVDDFALDVMDVIESRDISELLGETTPWRLRHRDFQPRTRRACGSAG